MYYFLIIYVRFKEYFFKAVIEMVRVQIEAEENTPWDQPVQTTGRNNFPDFSKTTFWRILREDLGLFPYK
jgi:hypothetical protein